MNPKLASSTRARRASAALVLAALSVACGSNGNPGPAGAGGSAAPGAGGTGPGSSGATSTAGSSSAGSPAVGTAGNAAAGNAAGGTTTNGGAGGVSATSGGNAGGMAGSGGAPVACQAPLPVTGTAVTVDVNLAMAGTTVAAEMMGVHTSAYDNSMTAATTPVLLKAAGVRSLRYPGGSYGDAYHWSTHTTTVSASGTAPYVAPGAHFGAFVALIDSIGAGAMITVNYGSNLKGTGPGAPQEAAAWVAYANGTAASTTSIGLDDSGTDWKTVGYWASLRAAAPLATDDGLNFLRIGRAAPVGIKYWELGNELYGNGFYYGGDGWEEDLHLAHDGTARTGNAKLSPVMYGTVFPSFATAMKAVDPTIKVGAVLHWPYTEYTSPDWNDSVLSSETCSAMDFGVNHWYAGTSFADLITRPHTDIPKMFSDLTAKVKARCPTKTGTIPLAVTEWGPNTLNFKITPPASTQLVGVFAADSYAQFMEQGAIHTDWLELHNDSYLGETDMAQWGYKGQQMAGYLANGGDAMVTATLETPPAAFASGVLQTHAAKHADGSLSVMVVNTSPTEIAAATIKITGLTAGSNLPCVGTRYTYAPVNGDNDGTVAAAPIFSGNDATNQVSVQVPAYSVVVVAFPKS
jgi:alpha-L-arabinofuranosidase